MWRRRRAALNEAVHELRRPLQALALAGSEAPVSSRIDLSVEMAASALERLDREINGGSVATAIEALSVPSLLEVAVLRWGARAEAEGASLVLRPPAEDAEAGDSLVRGDRWAIAQALDNLVLNAIEHGGPRIVVAGQASAGLLRIVVKDCGRPLAPVGDVRGCSGARLRDRLAGRERHGHGLRVVRRVAGAHGGAFSLNRSAGGAEAVFELPTAGPA